MATKATIAKGASISVRIGNTGQFVKIGGLKGFDGLGSGSAAVLDSTDLDSERKEKVYGLGDEGTLSLTMNYIENDAGQLLLQKARDDQATASFEIVVNTKKFAHDGLVLTTPITVGTDTLMEMTASVEITGKVTKSAVGATA